jgi:hypothetical protein
MLPNLASAPTVQPPPPPAPPPVEAPPEPEGLAAISLDPDVKKLCLHFEIEVECAKRLDEAMTSRQDTKESDLAKLYDILDDVGDPTGLLDMKIDDIVNGDFIGNILETREAKAVALNYNLSEEAAQKLYTLVSCRATKKGEDLVRMELLLEFSKDPSSTTVKYVDRVIAKELESLPDLSEAQDVMKKFDLDVEARDKLVEIVLARTEDSSALLGGLEVYFESVRSPSSALLALAGRLLAGGDVPDPHDPREKGKQSNDREHERSRERDRNRDRSRERERKRKSRSRSRRRSPSVKRRSRSRDRRK